MVISQKAWEVRHAGRTFHYKNLSSALRRSTELEYQTGTPATLWNTLTDREVFFIHKPWEMPMPAKGQRNQQKHSDERLEALLASAKRHGEQSEPDHEVGDLQDLVRLLWAAVPINRRSVVYNDFFDDHERW